MTIFHVIPSEAVSKGQPFLFFVKKNGRISSLNPKDFVTLRMENSAKVKFKDYAQDQLSLLPPSLEELIEENHPVRVINEVIDKVDLESLLQKYKGGGSSSYHPRMMLKVLVYAYVNNIYSSRKIESAIKENIHFMWLAAYSRPDHNTINRFRSDRLKGVFKEIFTQVVLMLVESGHIDLQKVYLDGTKIEANANKYTFVWGKSIKRYKNGIKKQLEELWHYAESVAKEEMSSEKPIDFEKLDAEKIEQTIETINTALKNKPIDKKKKRKLDNAKKNWSKNYRKYQEQEEILGERNSYSKTDTDATFMRLKNDPMKNGQLKAAYNFQITTSNQYVINYTNHYNPTDTRTLIPHLEEFNKRLKTFPKELTADAGYGSEENYEYLESKEIEAYVKYNYFHMEQHKKEKATPEFHQDKLYYNEESDFFVCPMGQRMHKVGVKERINESGYTQEIHLYEAQNCQGCPLRGMCHNSEGNRIIRVNHKLKKYKAKAKKRLLSEKGRQHRSQRPADVEAVFGNIKQNKKFTRLNLRGNEKVEIEIGLVFLSHNLLKYARTA